MIQSSKRPTELFERVPENPVLTANMWPYPANTVFNPGATRLQATAARCCWCASKTCAACHICAWLGAKTAWTAGSIDPKPTFAPHPHHPEEEWGVEDPRITYLPDKDAYGVLYTAYSHRGPGVALALTEDFRSFERYGLVFPPEDKDAALFPRQIDGRWWAIHRPVTSMGAHMFLSSSPDLRNWGQSRCILEARRGPWWDGVKVGLSAPPIETEKGWLLVYHGVKLTGGGVLYRNGLSFVRPGRPRAFAAALRAVGVRPPRRV